MSGRECSLQGNVTGFTDAADASRLMVEIRSAGRSMRAPLSPTGAFDISGLPEGQYEVTVTNVQGAVLARDFVSLPFGAGSLTLHLPEVKRERPPSGVVSVQRLQHKVPKAARKEFERAVQAAGNNDPESTVKHLQKAVEIDPEYMEAYNNLGTRYMLVNRTEQALECFEKALKLDPNAPEPAANAAIALLRLRRFEDAERASARALEIDQQSPLANLARGMALAAQGKEGAEAVRLLDRAADRFPAARLTAAEILVQTGDAHNARRQLERYLASGDRQYRGDAQNLLARISADE